MCPYESCIQIIIIIIINKIKYKKLKTKKKTKRKVKTDKEGERYRKKSQNTQRGNTVGEIFVCFFFSSLLSKIYGNQIVGFYRSKRQS